MDDEKCEALANGIRVLMCVKNIGEKRDPSISVDYFGYGNIALMRTVDRFLAEVMRLQTEATNYKLNYDIVARENAEYRELLDEYSPDDIQDNEERLTEFTELIKKWNKEDDYE